MKQCSSYYGSLYWSIVNWETDKPACWLFNSGLFPITRSCLHLYFCLWIFFRSLLICTPSSGRPLIVYMTCASRLTLMFFFFLLRTYSSPNARKWKAMPSKKAWLWYCGQTDKVKSELFPNKHFTKAVSSLSLWCWDNTEQVPSCGEKRCCKSDCYEVSKYSAWRPWSSIWWREESLQQDKDSYSSEWIDLWIHWFSLHCLKGFNKNWSSQQVWVGQPTVSKTGP